MRSLPAAPGEDPIFGEPVRRALESIEGERDPLRVASALRRLLPPELARRAAELHRLRQKARRRFPSEPPLFATTKGYEQASSEPVARVRARRFAEVAGEAWVADLTCGVGGDALALSRAGLRLVACERDPALAACARANLAARGRSARFVLAEAEREAVRADFVLLDPDRRAAGRRSLDPGAWSPTLEAALARARAARGACIKLPPSFAPEAAPPLEAPARWQWVSWKRELAEVALWTGALARVEPGPPLREATAIDAAGEARSLVGRPVERAPWPRAELERIRWLAEPDVAVIAAGLVGLLAERVGARPLAPRSAFLVAEEPPAREPALALLTPWRVLDTSPIDARRVRAMLARHDVGELRAIVRGHPDSPEALARRLRGRGGRPGTLVVARLERGHAAFLVEPAAGLVGDEGFEPPTSSL